MIELANLTLEELLALQERLPQIIKETKESTYDRSFEEAIAYLCRCCDGAQSEDGAGFNKADTGFGKYLNQQLEAKRAIASHAESGFKMVRKYKNQLEAVGITLPEKWETIAHQYPESIEPDIDTVNKSKHRLVLKGDRIVAYYPFDREINALIKTVSGWRFDGESKYWSMPVDMVVEVLEKFPTPKWQWDESLEGEVHRQEAAEAARLAALEASAIESAAKISELIAAADLDEQLLNGWYLRDYQKEGVKFLLSQTKQAGLYDGCILADDMGLGKTVTSLKAIAAMQAVYDCHAFVVAPVSLLENWQKEATAIGVAIETFSNAYQSIPLPVDRPYIVVCDEAHYFQNPKSKRTKQIMNLASDENCYGIWLLTGTPLKNGKPLNLLPLLKLVKHELVADEWEYKRRYCGAHKTRFGWDFNGAAHLDELSRKTTNVMLRRTKKDCLKELPEKTRIYKRVCLTYQQEDEYESKLSAAIADYKDRVEKGEVDAAAEALVTLNYLRKEGSFAKVDMAIELTEELLDQGQQVVLFTDFVDSAKALHEHLGGELLIGDTKDRQGAVDRFQAGESKVFIGTIKAGGVGITLTAASNTIMVDRGWTPGDVSQAEDRVFRMGQKYPVLIQWLQFGIDDKIDGLIADKQQRIELVMAGKRKTMRGLGTKKLAQELMKELLSRGVKN